MKSKINFLKKENVGSWKSQSMFGYWDVCCFDLYKIGVMLVDFHGNLKLDKTRADLLGKSWLSGK